MQKFKHFRFFRRLTIFRVSSVGRRGLWNSKMSRRVFVKENNPHYGWEKKCWNARLSFFMNAGRPIFMYRDTHYFSCPFVSIINWTSSILYPHFTQSPPFYWAEWKSEKVGQLCALDVVDPGDEFGIILRLSTFAGYMQHHLWKHWPFLPLRTLSLLWNFKISSTTFLNFIKFWGVVSAAVEQSRRRANMVAQGDGKFSPWGWPQNPSKPNQKEREDKNVWLGCQLWVLKKVDPWMLPVLLFDSHAQFLPFF